MSATGATPATKRPATSRSARSRAKTVRRKLGATAVLLGALAAMGGAYAAFASTSGAASANASADDIDAAMYAPDALVLELTPRQRVVDVEDLHRPPRYKWRVLPAR